MRNQKGEDRGAVLIVPVDEITGNIVLEWDPSKKDPLWKFPAGGIETIDVDPKDPGNIQKTARRAAERELEEETGLLIEKAKYLVSLGMQQKRTHVVYLFLALTNLRTLKKKGDEGEIPRAFSVDEIKVLKAFMPMHLPILKMAIEKIRA